MSNENVVVLVTNQNPNVGINVQSSVSVPTINIEGTERDYARHAGEADKLSTPRAIGLSGDAGGEVYFDGTEDSYIYAAINVITNEELEEMLQ